MEALDTKRRILGNEHPSTLNANNNMGVLLKTSKASTTRRWPYYVEALETRRRTFGPDHHQTMIVTYNLGLLLFDKGEHQEAMSYLTEAIDGLRRALGDSHPITLRMHRNT